MSDALLNSNLGMFLLTVLIPQLNCVWDLSNKVANKWLKLLTFMSIFLLTYAMENEMTVLTSLRHDSVLDLSKTFSIGRMDHLGPFILTFLLQTMFFPFLSFLVFFCFCFVVIVNTFLPMLEQSISHFLL